MGQVAVLKSQSRKRLLESRSCQVEVSRVEDVDVIYVSNQLLELD